MVWSRDILGLLGIFFGIIIVVMPEILAYLIGLYLIISGILMLLDRKK